MNNSTTLSYFERMTIMLDRNAHLRMYLYFVIVFNFFSSILAAVLNFLVIIAFVKTVSLRTPSYIQILSLTFSDLGVGVVTRPAHCIRLTAWLSCLILSHVFISISRDLKAQKPQGESKMDQNIENFLGIRPRPR